MKDMDKQNGGSLLAAICVAGPALVALIPMAAAPAMPAMAEHFVAGQNGTLFAQMVMTVPAIMLIVAAPIAGFVAARYGRRITLLLSLLIYVVGGGGVLLVDDQTSLIALRLLLGLAGGGLLTSSLALIGEHFEDNAREKVLGYATSVSSLVAALALAFGGALVDGLGWQAPFALYFLGVPLFVAAWVVVRPSRTVLRDDLAHEVGHLPALAPMTAYYALLILLTVGMFTPAIQVPFVLEARGVTSAAIQGSIIAVTSIVAMVSAGLYGWGRNFLGVHGFMTIDALSMGIGIILIALAPEIWVIFLGCVFVGIGAGMSEPAIASLIFDRTPAYVHALAMGLIVSALNLGQFINPLAMAPLRDWLGASGAFLVLGVVLVSVGVLIGGGQRGRLLERQSINEAHRKGEAL